MSGYKIHRDNIICFKCNDEQFEFIKPKLDKLGYINRIDILDFKKYPELYIMCNKGTLYYDTSVNGFHKIDDFRILVLDMYTFIEYANELRKFIKVPCINCTPELSDYIRPHLLNWGYNIIGKYHIDYTYLVINDCDKFGNCEFYAVPNEKYYNRELVDNVEEFLERAARLKGFTYKRKDMETKEKLVINGVEIKPNYVIQGTKDDKGDFAIAVETETGIKFITLYNSCYSSKIEDCFDKITRIYGIPKNSIDAGEILWSKELTYNDVAIKLFKNKQVCFINNGPEITRIKEYCPNEQNALYYNNCTSRKQAEKLIAINMLMNVAKYLNGDWKPDWNNYYEYKYYIGINENKNIFISYNDSHCIYQIYFKTKDLAKKAISILGEDVIKIALSTDW